MNVLALDTAGPLPCVAVLARGAVVEEPLPAERQASEKLLSTVARALRSRRHRPLRLRSDRGVLRAGLVHGASRGAVDGVGARASARDSRRGGLNARGPRGSRAPGRLAARDRRARRRPGRGRRGAVFPGGLPRPVRRRGAPHSRSTPRLPCRAPSPPCPGVSSERRRFLRPFPLARALALSVAAAPRDDAGSGRARSTRHLLAAQRRRGETWRSVSRIRPPTRSCRPAPSIWTRSRGSRESRSWSRGSASSSRASSPSRTATPASLPAATAPGPRVGGYLFAVSLYEEFHINKIATDPRAAKPGNGRLLLDDALVARPVAAGGRRHPGGPDFQHPRAGVLQLLRFPRGLPPQVLLPGRRGRLRDDPDPEVSGVKLSARGFASRHSGSSQAKTKGGSERWRITPIL